MLALQISLRRQAQALFLGTDSGASPKEAAFLSPIQIHGNCESRLVDGVKKDLITARTK